jgi:hypothetical protein
MAVGAGLGAAFGFFFGAGLCAGAGGPAGCNWTNTGFGTSRAASGSLLGSRVLSEGATTRTGTVCGWNPASENVTVNSLELTASEQGVRHDWPIEVLASAPAGSDSNCMVVAAGAAFGRSNCIQLGMLEQAARLMAQAAIAITRLMITTVRSCGRTSRAPPPKRRETYEAGRWTATFPAPRQPASPAGNRTPLSM